MQPGIARGRQASPFLCFHTRMRIFYTLLIITLLTALSFISAPSTRAQESVHVVSPGEGLLGIARQYGVSLSDLLAHNGLSDPDFVYVGQYLSIPQTYAAPAYTQSSSTQSAPTWTAPATSGWVTVSAGDSLSQIAYRHGMSMDELMRLNGLHDPNFIWVGQQLRVSGAATSQFSAQPEPVVEVAASTATADNAAPLVEAGDAFYVVRAGDTLSHIARTHGVSVQELLVANGLPSPDFVWVGQRLRVDVGTTPAPIAPKSEFHVTAPPADGQRWIEVDLTEQTLTAWQGDSPILRTVVSTGMPQYPTVTGTYAVGAKYTSQRMTGPGYDIPDVPWVMYFYSGYAIHGAYWHDRFGTPISHGCVNVRMDEAEFLYHWAEPGTEVHVHN